MGRPRADIGHTAHRLSARYPLRAAALRGGPPHLAYRWFCRLGLHGRVPDHSTFSKNRHGRFRDGDVHRLLFEQVVRACAEAGLVAGRDTAIDASTIDADTGRERKFTGCCICRRLG
ncbi:MAG: transposase [Acetobacteraceae bacterium]|nr:transposase [Acetobacteraceae bacterium]